MLEFSVLLVSLFFLSLAGCGGDPPSEDAGLDSDVDADADADGDSGPTEPCPSDMVLVDDGLGNPFCIDVYEYPNEVDVAPSVSMPWYAVRNACVDVRKQLCVEDEWERACAGTPEVECAGRQVVSGARPLCESDFGVRDMPGNVAEWTATPGGSVTFYVRGGTGDTSLGCDEREEYEAEGRRPDLGFRCCRAARNVD